MTLHDSSWLMNLLPIAIVTKKYYILDGQADWNIVSRAWWDAVDLIEQSAAEGVFAVDMTLELRVMGGSEVQMSK